MRKGLQSDIDIASRLRMSRAISSRSETAKHQIFDGEGFVDPGIWELGFRLHLKPNFNLFDFLGGNDAGRTLQMTWLKLL